MTLEIALYVLGWATSGFLAYGVCYAACGLRSVSICYGALGPLGLAVAVLVILADHCEGNSFKGLRWGDD